LEIRFQFAKIYIQRLPMLSEFGLFLAFEMVQSLLNAGAVISDTCAKGQRS
jgi:hypothetical protein